MVLQESIDAADVASPAAARLSAQGEVKAWLYAVAALIFVMVLVGGATRLTESGLSITQWKPVTGVMPPLSEAEWREEFARYQQIPQFSKLNPDMTIEGFKTIFYWEWSHRLLARIIGAAFVLPALWFWFSGRFKGAVGRRVLLATCLLALEPIVGWWMVSSGVGRAHRGRAGAACDSSDDRRRDLRRADLCRDGLERAPARGGAKGFALAAAAFVALVFAQLGFGALVAGLRAGLVYNTWPLMDGRVVPEGAFALSPWPRSIIDDVTTAQFDHRLIAYLVVAYALVQAWAAVRAAPGSALARRAMALAGLALCQAALGIFTLIWVVPIGLALAHQALALLLFGMAVVHFGAM